MEQNIPQINTSLLSCANFNYSVSLEKYKNDVSLPNTAYRIDPSEDASTFFARDYSWEYFCNELEFE
jgi:hypothetical protein